MCSLQHTVQSNCKCQLNNNSSRIAIHEKPQSLDSSSAAHMLFLLPLRVLLTAALSCANRCGIHTMCVCWCLATRSPWRFCAAPSWQPTTLSCLRAATELSTSVMTARTLRSASGWTPWRQMWCMSLVASVHLVGACPPFCCGLSPCHGLLRSSHIPFSLSPKRPPSNIPSSPPPLAPSFPPPPPTSLRKPPCWQKLANSKKTPGMILLYVAYGSCLKLSHCGSVFPAHVLAILPLSFCHAIFCSVATSLCKLRQGEMG